MEMNETIKPEEGGRYLVNDEWGNVREAIVEEFSPSGNYVMLDFAINGSSWEAVDEINFLEKLPRRKS